MNTRALRLLVNSSTNSRSGGKKLSTSARRGLALVLIAFLMTGCTKAVEIPPADIDKPEYRWPGSYRIRVTTHEEFLVRKFSTTDSTIVVEQLLSTDERYGSAKQPLPIVIPRANVASIAAISKSPSTGGIVIGGVIIGLAVFLILVSSNRDEYVD